jgi:hypothetical protein
MGELLLAHFFYDPLTIFNIEIFLGSVLVSVTAID